MHTIEIKTTITVAGTADFRYRFQLIGCPSRAAMEVPTTLADAPMGVALPPMSVPMAKVQARIDKSAPVAAASVRITGIIVAAKGMLSTKALQIAEPQMMIATMTTMLPPLIRPMTLANISRRPVRRGTTR